MKSKRTKETQDFKLHVLGSSTRPDWRDIVHSPAVKRIVAILSHISSRNTVPEAVNPFTYTILPKLKTTSKMGKSKSGNVKISQSGSCQRAQIKSVRLSANSPARPVRPHSRTLRYVRKPQKWTEIL